MQTDKRSDRLGLLLATVLVVTLALPTLRWMTLGRADGGLAGYADDVPPRPALRWASFRDRSFQRWVERYADVNQGFRAVLVKSFNEVNFRLFGEAPKLQLYSTAAHGLYSRMSLDALYDQTVHRDALEQAYRAEAKKLLRIQEMLASQRKVFAVVIGASKPYVYPEGLGARFFKGRADDPLADAASFGDILKAQGVKVIDGDRSLREFAKRTNIQTHANSGVHWNYYAGCVVASEVVELARTAFAERVAKLDCGTPVDASPHMVDIDGWALLNVWTNVGLMTPTPYPPFGADAPVATTALRFLIVDDSFADQIIYSLRATGSYARLVTSGYFRVRAVDDRLNPAESIAASAPGNDDDPVRKQVLQDLARSDVVLLEMVDYNIGRLGYGFADYFLAHADGLARIAHGAGIGAYGEETDGTNRWNWVAHDIRFDLDPFVVGDRPLKTRVRFEYATKGPQTLVGTLTTRDGGRRTFTARSAGDRMERFDEVLDIRPDALSGIELSTDGTASTLGPNDPRKVSWILRNLVLEPVSDADR
jgi:hypothetical protein